MKVVGKRQPAPGNLENWDALQKLAISLRGNKPFHPRGVFRFKTWEEKAAWDLKMMGR
ncbi:MAG: hypothetical protein Q7P63_14240 [Verrucomicrobiota bacterium JB022]|nr:hypothetical protein [Verrucomicrobiota bacterium JB022]